MAESTLDNVDDHLRAIISNHFMLIVQAHDYQGTGTQHAMTAEIKDLIQNLLLLTQASNRLPTRLPLEIIQYVEQSRNPDIYTREFVELVMKNNQQQKGRSRALAQFQQTLARQMEVGIPELAEEVRRVMEATGSDGQGK